MHTPLAKNLRRQLAILIISPFVSTMPRPVGGLVG